MQPIPLQTLQSNQSQQLTTQVTPYQTFTVPHEFANGAKIHPTAHAHGIYQNHTMRTQLWQDEQTNNLVAAPLEQRYRYRNILVQSLYKFPDQLKYYKIYIEHELTIKTRDHSQVLYQVKRT